MATSTGEFGFHEFATSVSVGFGPYCNAERHCPSAAGHGPKSFHVDDATRRPVGCKGWLGAVQSLPHGPKLPHQDARTPRESLTSKS